MDKRRKYNGKNKLSFIIILVVSIVIIGIFSLFIFKYSKISKIKYEIESGSVIQDVDKNHITLDNSAALKIKWGGKYYLINEEENINLGKKVIVYNTVTGRMNLYGTFYEINADGKIIELKDENILKNTTETKFYKLDDREDRGRHQRGEPHRRAGRTGSGREHHQLRHHAGGGSDCGRIPGGVHPAGGAGGSLHRLSAL